MKVLKFGGSILSDAKKFILISEILKKKSKTEQILVVLSAPYKITDYLILSIKNNVKNKKNKSLKKVKSKVNKILKTIYETNKKFEIKKTKNEIEFQINIIEKIFSKNNNSNKINKKKQAIIMSKGEIISTEIMNSILKSKNVNSTILDPIKNTLSDENYLNAKVNIKESTKKLKKIKQYNNKIILIPGFISGNLKNEVTILGRNGSDYSAAILSNCIDATSCEIWKDVKGICTANPKNISKAKLVERISYEEALELSKCGSEIIHPQTIYPLYKKNIPCIIKNFYCPETKGTIISNKSKNVFKQIVKSITYLKDFIIIKILFKKEINRIVLKKILKLVTSNNQYKIFDYKKISEKKITILTSIKEDKNPFHLINNILKKHLAKKEKYKIKIKKKLSIVSIIGKNIVFKIKILYKIISAIKEIDIKIISVLLNDSKNSISIIIKKKYTKKIINSIHNKFFNINVNKTSEVFLIGVGGVGYKLLKQINLQKDKLKKNKIDIKILGISNSKNYIIKTNNINTEQYQNLIQKKDKKINIKEYIKKITKKKLNNPIIVDCTSSKEISENYDYFIKKGFNIIASNKKANTSSMKYYKKIRNYLIRYKKKFLYETNVGAGLPIIENLKNLIISGDQIIKFRGILSGSLSYIFGKLEENYSIVEAVKQAQKLGFTEPNPIDDLSGIDVARKILIIAREIGINLELKNINISKILPKNIVTKNINKKDLFKNLNNIQNFYSDKIRTAKKQKKVLRLVGSITENKKCQVKIEKISKNDPLYNIKNGENAFIFYSKYYNPTPLILRGYGAGNTVTSAGVFSDLLRIIS
ncbi:bifunctional aspartate kinase/homoserine dehydrogenase I [Buchnera aphidicola (Chaitoregma tattakana)]|uniref:bifunctional aspartate kinase/homoserine dehydrogenase I n=1 Tax=Buchnera aphidicola TaxID=9 RepID=UPI0031B87500